MTLPEAAILGVVEGITEFLPISSTGHLILVSHFLNIPQDNLVKSFEIAIQLGAILSVLVLYGKTLFRERGVLLKVAAAFIPTAIIGGVFYKIIKGYLIGNPQVVLWSLFLGGLFIILFERFYKESAGSGETCAAIPYKTAILVGVFQAVAVIPGVSRAAATILGGLMLGLKRKVIIEFSFLLAIPTMLAATILDAIKSAPPITVNNMMLLGVGSLTAFIVALGSIKFLLSYIGRNNFVSFGIYRMFVAVIFWKLLN